MSDLFYPLVIPAILITIYYYTIFSTENIKNYSKLWYFFFISHLIIIYMWLFIEISEMSIGTPFNNSKSLITDVIYYTMTLLQLT